MEHESTFVALHKQFRGRVLNYIRRRISSEETAEELAADVFRIAWEKSESVPEPTLAWLLTVARNLIGNEYHGRQWAQELLGHASVTTTQVYTLVTADTLREVYAAAHPRALG
jgi:DNA-directed RNA polymerase specialized sigma24 family protein